MKKRLMQAKQNKCYLAVSTDFSSKMTFLSEGADLPGPISFVNKNIFRSRVPVAHACNPN
jgi:hypothetical protein